MARDDLKAACSQMNELRPRHADLRAAIFYIRPPVDNGATASEVDRDSDDDHFQTCDFEVYDAGRKAQSPRRAAPRD
jgi:hypothetical protein